MKVYCILKSAFIFKASRSIIFVIPPQVLLQLSFWIYIHLPVTVYALFMIVNYFYDSFRIMMTERDILTEYLVESFYLLKLEINDYIN